MYNFVFDMCDMELLGVTKGEFFCLEGYLVKGFNFGSFEDERLVLGK